MKILMPLQSSWNNRRFKFISKSINTYNYSIEITTTECSIWQPTLYLKKIIIGYIYVDIWQCWNNGFLDSLSLYVLLQDIFHLTRVTGHTQTIVDNIFVNFISNEAVSGNLNSIISDHLLEP